MNDTVEKTIHINFVGRNLITNEVDKVTGSITGLNINLQRMPYFFNSAGYALNQLNEKLFGSNKAVQDLSNAFLLMGTAMRVVQIMQTMITTLEVLASKHILAAIATKAHGIAAAITQGIISWGAAVPLILGAAIAAAGVGALYATRQFGGYQPEGGLVMTHPGEWIIPKGGGGGGSVYVDARGSTFSSDYDADRLGERMLFAMKRAGVTGP